MINFAARVRARAQQRRFRGPPCCVAATCIALARRLVAEGSGWPQRARDTARADADDDDERDGDEEDDPAEDEGSASSSARASSATAVSESAASKKKKKKKKKKGGAAAGDASDGEENAERGGAPRKIEGSKEPVDEEMALLDSVLRQVTSNATAPLL